MRHALRDKLCRSDGTRPPLPQRNGPWAAALRRVVVGVVWARQKLGGAASRADWWWHKLCWWLFAGIELWWPGYDAPSAAEWCGDRCRIPTDEPRMRGAENGVLPAWKCGQVPGLCGIPVRQHR